jgi:hypothetical protein
MPSWTGIGNGGYFEARLQVDAKLATSRIARQIDKDGCVQPIKPAMASRSTRSS